MLLPKCAQWIGRASIYIDMVQGLQQPYQTASLVHALNCMSGVTQLTLLGNGGGWKERGLHYHPAPLSLSQLTDVLPKLASLHIRRMPLHAPMIESLMADSQLQHLRLKATPVYGLGDDEFCLDTKAALSFRYPTRRPDPLQLIEQRADERKAKQRNRRLRLVLWKRWNKAVQRLVGPVTHPTHDDHRRDMLDTCEK